LFRASCFASPRVHYTQRSIDWRPAGWSNPNGERAENNRRAKFYRLTAAGKKQLDEEWETWKRFSGAVELILRDADHPDAN